MKLKTIVVLILSLSLLFLYLGDGNSDVKKLNIEKYGRLN